MFKTIRIIQVIKINGNINNVDKQRSATEVILPNWCCFWRHLQDIKEQMAQFSAAALPIHVQNDPERQK